MSAVEKLAQKPAAVSIKSIPNKYILNVLLVIMVDMIMVLVRDLSGVVWDCCLKFLRLLPIQKFPLWHHIKSFPSVFLPVNRKDSVEGTKCEQVQQLLKRKPI